MRTGAFRRLGGRLRDSHVRAYASAPGCQACYRTARARPPAAGVQIPLRLGLLRLLTLSAAAQLAAAPGPPSRPPDCLPPAWTALTPSWKATWDETLTVNPETNWTQSIRSDPALAQAQPQLLALRRIAFLEAMLQRYPAEKEKHAAAFLAVADAYESLGCPWRRNEWLLKLVRAFPGRRDLLPEAYRKMIAIPFSASDSFPSVRDWEFALREVLALHEAGAIPDDHAVVAEAYLHLAELLGSEQRYGDFQDFLDRARRAGQRVPAVRAIAEGWLGRFGYEKRPARAIEHARDLELEIRWEALQLGGARPDLEGARPDEIQKFLDAAAPSEALIRAGPERCVAPWTAADLALGSVAGETLKGLRAAQDAAVVAWKEWLLRQPDPNDLYALFRRYPWAAALHEAMQEQAEGALHHGELQPAAAAFADVLRHAADPALRRQARLGLWLALSSAGGPGGVPAAAGDPDAGTVPWRGAPRSLERIFADLKAAEDLTAPPSLAQVAARGARLPPAATAAANPEPGNAARYGLRILSAAALADGRAYALAATSDAPAPLLCLVCADSRDGRLLWRRALGKAPAPADAMDPLGAVSLTQGAVYVLTGMGSLARCDPRDGAVQWVCGYESAVRRPMPDLPAARTSSPPPVAIGDCVIAAPADHSGVLAFDCENGRLRWEAQMVPARHLGACADGVVAAGDRWLTALEARSGRQRWCRSFEGEVTAHPGAAGNEALVLAGNSLFRLSASTGATLEEHRLPPDGRSRHLLADGSLVGEPAPMAALQPAATNAGAALRLPLQEVFCLPSAHAQPVIAADGSENAFWALAGRRVLGIRIRPFWQIAWSRILPQPADAGLAAGGRVFVRCGRRLHALDGAGGSPLWSAELRFTPFSLDSRGSVLVAGSKPSPSESWVAALDAASGRLLWQRPFDEVRLGNGQGLQGLALSPGGDASLKLYSTALFSDVPGGWQPAETTVDLAAGSIREIRRALPGQSAWPPWLLAGPHGLDSVSTDWTLRSSACANPSREPFWMRRIDVGDSFYKTPAHVGLWRPDSGPYVACVDTIYHFESAEGKEQLYQFPSGGERTFYCTYAVLESGTHLLAISGIKGRYIRAKERRGRSTRYEQVSPQIYVDCFDRASGRHLGRQSLPGVSCTQTPHAGPDAQAGMVGNGIVVADADALRVFANRGP